MTSAIAPRPAPLPPATAAHGAAASPAPFQWPAGRALLTAEWRHLAMLNYEVDPRVLEPFVPAGTQLDFWRGRTYASVVGFLFRRTRVFGLPIPFHANFEEVNLRFYVRRETGGACRRGVVFLRELAPRRAVAIVANSLYGERYLTVPMSHHIAVDPTDDADHPPRELEYRWQFAGRAHRITMQTAGHARPLMPGSLEEFIAEHYWGYTALPRGAANEYLVAHPPWHISPAAAELDCDVAALYGERFAPFLQGDPASAFWADGSPVRVYAGRRLTT